MPQHPPRAGRRASPLSCAHDRRDPFPARIDVCTLSEPSEERGVWCLVALNRV